MHYGRSSCPSGLPDEETFIGLAVNISQLLGSAVSFSVQPSDGPKILHTKFYSVIIFIPLVWGKCKFKIYSDDATERHAGKEVGIVIANHRYTNDWIIDFIAAEQYRNVSNTVFIKINHFKLDVSTNQSIGILSTLDLARISSCFETDHSMLGQCKAFIKSEIAMIPFLGWAMWFNEFGFLTRAKASKDLKTLQRASEHFRGESHFPSIQKFHSGRPRPRRPILGYRFQNGTVCVHFFKVIHWFLRIHGTMLASFISRRDPIHKRKARSFNRVCSRETNSTNETTSYTSTKRVS